MNKFSSSTFIKCLLEYRRSVGDKLFRMKPSYIEHVGIRYKSVSIVRLKDKKKSISSGLTVKERRGVMGTVVVTNFNSFLEFLNDDGIEI